MSEYTPTTEEVRKDYSTRMAPHLDSTRVADFDRWLAEYTAEVRAKALEDVADAMDADPDVRDPLRIRADWLRARAEKERT